MIKILPLGNTVKQYLREWGERNPRVLMDCPECKHELWQHGSYLRWVATRRERFLIPIYRLRCPHCRLTISLLPPFLHPHAHFLTCTREAVARLHFKRNLPLRRVAAMVATGQVGCISERTLARWLKHIREIARAVNALLASKLLELAPGLDLPRYAAGPETKQGPTKTLLALCDLYRHLSMALGARATAFSASTFGLLNARLLPTDTGQYL